MLQINGGDSDFWDSLKKCATDYLKNYIFEQSVKRSEYQKNMDAFCTACLNGSDNYPTTKTNFFWKYYRPEWDTIFFDEAIISIYSFFRKKIILFNQLSGIERYTICHYFSEFRTESVNNRDNTGIETEKEKFVPVLSGFDEILRTRSLRLDDDLKIELKCPPWNQRKKIKHNDTNGSEKEQVEFRSKAQSVASNFTAKYNAVADFFREQPEYGKISDIISNEFELVEMLYTLKLTKSNSGFTDLKDPFTVYDISESDNEYKVFYEFRKYLLNKIYNGRFSGADRIVLINDIENIFSFNLFGSLPQNRNSLQLLFWKEKLLKLIEECKKLPNIFSNYVVVHIFPGKITEPDFNEAERFIRFLYTSLLR